VSSAISIQTNAIESGGAKPMNIRDVMTPNPRTVSPDDSILNAARIMRDEDTGAVPVVDQGRPVGMLTDRDIVIRAVADGGQMNRPVRDIATTNVVVCTPEMSTREANELMREHQVRRLPVVEGERLVGVVSLGDLAVQGKQGGRSGETLERIRKGVKERGVTDVRGQEHVFGLVDAQQRQEHQHDQNDDSAQPRTAGAVEHDSAAGGLMRARSSHARKR
jgi:CBS domain-containing protein